MKTEREEGDPGLEVDGRTMGTPWTNISCSLPLLTTTQYDLAQTSISSYHRSQISN